MAKLSVSRAWDETRGVLARDGKLIATVAAAFFVLPGLVAGLLQPPAVPGELPKPGWPMLAMVAAMVVSMIGQLAVIRIAAGPALAVGEAIRHGLERFPSFLGAVLLFVAPLTLVLVGLVRWGVSDPQNPNPVASLLVLVLLPVFVFLFVRLSLLAPVASQEAVGPLAAIKRSWALSRGSFWRLFAFLLLWAIAAFATVVAVDSVVGSIVRLAFGDADGITVGALLVELVGQVLTAALTVVVAVMLARMYVQLSGGRAGEAEVSVPSSAD